MVAVICDLQPDERMEGALVDTVITVTYDGPVEILRCYQDQRIVRGTECFFDLGGVKQAERDIQRLTEAPVWVIVDFSRVYDDSDPQLVLRLPAAREACVVVRQEPAESGDDLGQHKCLGCLVNRMEERKNAVAAVNEAVTMA